MNYFALRLNLVPLDVDRSLYLLADAWLARRGLRPLKSKSLAGSQAPVAFREQV
jgi:hypothetical protein